MSASDALRPGAPSRVWAAVHAAGELLITFALVLFLLTFYSLVWTNVQARAAAGEEIARLQTSWEAPVDAGPPVPEGGRAFALLTIPRLGESTVHPIVEGSGKTGTGIEMDDLTTGVAHYPGTAAPGELGNFALAGHRATHGEPFRDLDQLQVGDEVLVRTRQEQLTYVMTGYEIVSPSKVDVLAPVPGKPNAVPQKARMTLTTCHPRWASTWRLVVHTELKSRRPA